MTSLEQDQLLPEEAERDGDLVEKTARSGSGRMWATTASICCYAVLALIANLPLMPWNSADMRQGDLTQVTWSLVWSPWSLLHGHNPFYTDYLNFPVGMNLSQNTTAPLLGWLSSPVTFGINAIASVNILQWLAFFLTASSMYFVGRRLLRSSLSAFLAGLIYGFSPYMVGQGLDHMVINFLPFPPLILLGFYELLIRREGSAIRWGAFLGACEVGQFLISPEIAVTVLLVAVLALSFLGISRPRQIRAALRFGLKGLILAGTIVIVSIAYPVWIMVAGPYHYTGAAHPGGLTADIAFSVARSTCSGRGLIPSVGPRCGALL